MSSDRRILCARTHAGLLQPATAFLRSESSNGPIVVIASEKLAADELTWTACRQIFTGVYRHTVSQLALEIARPALAASGVYVAGTLALEAIAALVVDRARSRQALQYFAPVADRPRFARALLRTITELRLEHVASHQLRGFPGAPAGLALLMDAFEAELRAREVADLAAGMSTAVHVLASAAHPYCGAAVLLLCPGLKHRAERDLIQSLTGQARAVLAL